MKQRIAYIDELKGFAILMVVIGHVFYFSFRIVVNDYNSPWSDFIYSFHMPLFAFLSGLFIKPFTDRKALRKTLERLMLPLLVMGSLYTIWRGRSLTDFACNDFKFGYWYFLFLLLAYFIVTLYDLCERNINRKQRKCMDALLMLSVCLIISRGGNTCL